MAIFEPGPLIGRIRGKVGGVVFTNSRSSPVIRRLSKPIDPANPSQNFIRANLSTIAAHWRDGITPANRATWNATAISTRLRNSLGAQITPSGRDLFFRTNVFNLLHGLALFDTSIAPYFPFFPQATISELMAVGIQLTAQGSTPPFTALAISTLLSPPLNATLNQWSGPWATRIQTAWNNPVIPLTIVPIGNLPSNGRYFLAITPRNADGGVGFVQRYTIDITIV